MSIKISIVTAVLNGEAFIRQTVESILSQEGDFELEYIIRDGESTDNTLKILEEYSDRCTIISQKDGSPQEAINAGFEMATGDIYAWLNADDLYMPGTLKRVVEAFQANPNKQWCYGLCSIIDSENREIRKPITLCKTMLGWFYSRNILLTENYINQPATFWKRELWEEVCDLDRGFKAAWDYQLWLEMAGKSRAISLHQMLAQFRRHDSSISETSFEQQFAEELQICKCYGNFLHYWVHALNRWKIVMAYKFLNSDGKQ